MTTTLNGRILGQAERATRAVLDRLLARSGTAFERWVAINFIATSAVADRADLVDRMATGLRTEPSAVAAILDAAVQDGLLTGDIELTAAGRARYEEISAGVDGITAQLYGDLTPEELETAGRVLLQVTDRANALV